jgi:hypothetical protein
MANNSDSDTLELTLRRGIRRDRRRPSGLTGVKSRAVLRTPKDGRLAKHGALFVTLGGGIGYYIGVRNLSGFANELGISTSDLGVDFRDYILFAVWSSLAIIAGAIAFYLSRYVFDLPVKGGVRRERNKWRPLLVALAVGYLWLLTQGVELNFSNAGLELDFSNTGLYEMSVIMFGIYVGALCAGIYTALEALDEEVKARQADRQPIVDWWVVLVGLGFTASALFFGTNALEDLISLVRYSWSDWPVEYAQGLRKWSEGNSPRAPDEPDTLDLILTPTLVGFEMDGTTQCGIRVSQNVVLQDGETMIISEPNAFRVGACSSDGQDFVPRPEP